MDNYKLSICIPTYNRASHLTNCLQSIISLGKISDINFEVCVSDNCSTDNTEEVILNAKQVLPIKYHRNDKNLGMTKNFLKVVEMAKGEFVWLIGDDDLLLSSALTDLFDLFTKYPKVDFFYVNAFHLKTEFVFSFKQPFNTSDLPNDMKPFSSYTNTGEINFIDLVDPKISFDFLGGIFLSVFRRKNWNNSVNALDKVAINDSRIFSHFDNTFPHLKIFSKAFANSKAFFNAKPLSVCLTGAREWAPMGPLVMSVRLVEGLSEYKKNGLPYWKYLYCKNYALKNFIPDLGSMIYYKTTGLEYIKPIRLIFYSFLFPNFYFSFVNFCIRKLSSLFKTNTLLNLTM